MVFEDRAIIDRDRVYGSARVLYLGLLDPVYVEGSAEGFLERIGEVDPEEEMLFRDL